MLQRSMFAICDFKCCRFHEVIFGTNFQALGFFLSCPPLVWGKKKNGRNEGLIPLPRNPRLLTAPQTSEFNRNSSYDLKQTCESPK